MGMMEKSVAISLALTITGERVPYSPSLVSDSGIDEKIMNGRMDFPMG